MAAAATGRRLRRPSCLFAAAVVVVLGSLVLHLFTDSNYKDWLGPSSLSLQQQHQQHRSLPLDTTTGLSSSETALLNDNEVTGVVHYQTTQYSGWNNQREGAMIAWIISYLTGHTLQLKNFHPAFTGSWSDNGGYLHGDLWDLVHLRKYVYITLIPYDRTAIGYEHEVALHDRFETPEQVAQLRQYKTISFACGWSFLQHQLPWLTSDHLIFQRMLESFTYNSVIRETAERVVRQMKGPFIALHVRKNRRPAADCDEWGLQPILAGDGYERGGCLGLNWSDPRIVELLFPDEFSNNMSVYVAHDGNLGRSLNKKYRLSSDFDMFKTLRPAIISAVEQEVAIRAEYFVASTHSSWSEYVIYKRLLSKKKDGRKNYDIWVRNLDIMDPVTTDKERALPS